MFNISLRSNMAKIKEKQKRGSKLIKHPLFLYQAWNTCSWCSLLSRLGRTCDCCDYCLVAHSVLFSNSQDLSSQSNDEFTSSSTCWYIVSSWSLEFCTNCYSSARGDFSLLILFIIHSFILQLQQQLNSQYGGSGGTIKVLSADGVSTSRVSSNYEKTFVDIQSDNLNYCICLRVFH